MNQLANAVNNAEYNPRNQLVHVLGDQRFDILARHRPFMSRVVDAVFVATVIIWINLVGVNNMMSLLANHSLVIRLSLHGFTESVTPFLEIVGVNKFVRLMKNSYFVIRIQDAEFHALMHFWLNVLDPVVSVHLASNRHVIARLGKPDLQDLLMRLCQSLPSFNEFMYGSRQVTDAEFVGYAEFMLLRV